MPQWSWIRYSPVETHLYICHVYFQPLLFLNYHDLFPLGKATLKGTSSTSFTGYILQSHHLPWLVEKAKQANCSDRPKQYN